MLSPLLSFLPICRCVRKANKYKYRGQDIPFISGTSWICPWYEQGLASGTTKCPCPSSLTSASTTCLRPVSEPILQCWYAMACVTSSRNFNMHVTYATKVPTCNSNHTCYPSCHKIPARNPWPIGSEACREEKSVHNHHRKKIFWRTLLASKKNFPGRWWIQKPYKNQENHIHHRNLSSVDPLFFCKEKFCTGAGLCMVSFSQAWRPPKQTKTDWQASPQRKMGHSLRSWG